MLRNEVCLNKTEGNWTLKNKEKKENMIFYLFFCFQVKLAPYVIFTSFFVLKMRNLKPLKLPKFTQLVSVRGGAAPGLHVLPCRLLSTD